PRLFAHQLARPRVQAGAAFDTDRMYVLDESARAVDRAARAVKGGEKAVACGVDLLAVELPKPPTDERVMLLEKPKPRGVPELGRPLRRRDDVGKEHGCEHTIRLGRSADARQEPFGLAHRLFVHLVVDPGEQSAQAGQLGNRAASDSLRDVLRLRALRGLAEN